MKYYIMVYKNTHNAMEADKKLTELGISFRVMPTPTAITQSCGICTRVDDEDVINDIIKNNILEFKNIYCKNIDKFEKIL